MKVSEKVYWTVFIPAFLIICLVMVLG